MKDIFTAFMQLQLPFNPIPFLNALIEGVRQNATYSIKTNKAKSLLHMLNQMAYGQLYQINGYDEYRRLANLFEPNNEDNP